MRKTEDLFIPRTRSFDYTPTKQSVWSSWGTLRILVDVRKLGHMYFRLSSDLDECNVYIERDFREAISFIGGEILEGAPPVPLRFTMEVDDDEDGNPMEPRLDAYFPEESLMHKRLVAVMESAGVDNIQTFPAILTDGGTDQTNDDYVAVNVVGLVSCANMDESETEPLADVYFFQNLVIDPKKTGDMLAFRLAESPMEIILHEKVANAIQEGEFTGVVLEALTEA